MHKLLGSCGCVGIIIVCILIFAAEVKVMSLVLPGNGIINVFLVSAIIVSTAIILDTDPKKGE